MVILLEYFKLMRINKPVGFLLLFAPCAFGLAIADAPLDIYALFFFGSIIMRSAGCIINDIIDRDIDRKVDRTKKRPIANKTISVFDATILTILLFIAGAIILTALTRIAIDIALITAILVVLYPIMKRIINWPQLFLGITFNTGVLIAYASIKNTISNEAIILYFASVFWTLGYDTIYGFQDIKDDKTVGVKSTSILFENYPRLFVGSCYTITVMLLLYLGFKFSYALYYYVFLAIALYRLGKTVIKLNVKDPQNCLEQFQESIKVGTLIWLALINHVMI